MTELLIVGGGITGLWAGVMAERAGIPAVLVERDRIGSGASGGLVGALMPYMPDRWDEKKQFQLDALLDLEDEIAGLEAATGVKAGYRRTGRIIPLPKPHLRDIALRHQQDALAHWRRGERQFYWNVCDQCPEGMPEISAEKTESGVVYDTLAARVDPRALTCTLQAYLQNARHVRIDEGRQLLALDPQAGVAQFATGNDIAFGTCVLAAGVESFGMLDALKPGRTRSSGAGVKGQAALLRARLDPAMPVLFYDGVYVIAHDSGLVAIGSTSENTYADPLSTDHQLEALIARAVALVPALSNAPVMERWAGLRPKAIGRDPMIGRHPAHERLMLLTGGFKISFGLAHRLAAHVISEICGQVMPGLPRSFTAASHIEMMSST